MLGFQQNSFENQSKETKPINLGVNKSLFVRLNELNTNENLFARRP